MNFLRYIILYSIFFLFTSGFANDKFVKQKSEPVIQTSVFDYISQTDSANIPVWIYFTDKGLFSQKDYVYQIQNINISERTLKRRQKTGKRTGFFDLRVYGPYQNELSDYGFKIRKSSRWLNAVSGFLPRDQLHTVAQLAFVQKIDLLRSGKKVVPLNPGKQVESLKTDNVYLYGPSAPQLEQLNIPVVHEYGYTGRGVLVTVLDTGFRRDHVALQHINVVAEYDFIHNDESTVNNLPADWPTQHNHGTEVLSVLAGKADDQLIGPAFGADFILGKTEVVLNEDPIEEDYWVAAAEWAEALGTDIISSSVGYTDWYNPSDLDGNTAVTTRAADMAVRLGVFVCVSAGNDRINSWYYIDPPADADSVVAVGAVDSKGTVASFSSAGPTSDGRIKPEVMARGLGVRAVDPTGVGEYQSVSGTSYSAPLVAGAAALLLEAHPKWTPVQLREALMETADRADNPDNLYGWGIVDAYAALHYLQRGDINGDDEITINDVWSVAEIAMDDNDYSEEQRKAADINRDGSVNLLDVLKAVKQVQQ